MTTQHVPGSLWRRTLDDMSRAYDGAIVSLEILRGDDVGARPEVLDSHSAGSAPTGAASRLRALLLLQRVGVTFERIDESMHELIELGQFVCTVSRVAVGVARRCRCRGRRCATRTSSSAA